MVQDRAGQAVTRGDLTRHQEDDDGTQNGRNELCRLHAGSAGCRRCSASVYVHVEDIHDASKLQLCEWRLLRLQQLASSLRASVSGSRAGPMQIFY